MTTQSKGRYIQTDALEIREKLALSQKVTGKQMRRLIGIAEVCRRTGRSKASINRYLMRPELGFPKPVRLGPRDRGWYEDEIDRWIEKLVRL